MWLIKVAFNPEDINNLSLQNPRPFAKWFTNGNREYIPLNTGQEEGVDEEVQSFLSEQGYEITNYRGGYCKSGNRIFRIAKVIELLRNKELKEFQNRFQKGEIYSIDRDIKSVNNYFDDLLNTFTNSSYRTNKGETGLMVVISQDAMDIATMSTGRDWTSCMELDKGSHHQSVYCEIKEGGLIAYLIRANDKDIKNPLARVLIRRFVNQEGDSVAIPENTVYGNAVEGFEDVVKQWLQSKQGIINPGHYQRKGGKWSDTFPEKMLVAPTGKEDVLKWLRKEQPVIYTEWVVEDGFPGEDFPGEDKEGYAEERISPSFKTEEEAQKYIKENSMNLRDEKYFREQISNNYNEPSWMEEDENGDWRFDRFTIRKKEKNFN